MGHRLPVEDPPLGSWHPPRSWAGEDCIVVGGGPSLLKYSLEWTKSCNVIAVNNAYAITPWADYLFFHDRRWLDWHWRDVLQVFKGRIVTTSTQKLPIASVCRMKKSRGVAVDLEDCTVAAGFDSGTMAVNLAFHLGVKRIALAGFDMGFTNVAELQTHVDKETLRELQTPIKRDGWEIPESRKPDYNIVRHWHKEHPVPPRESNYARFLAQYPDVIKGLDSRGVKLVSLTPTRIPVPIVSRETLCTTSSRTRDAPAPRSS
jgi:hypothetical protein